MTTRIIAVRHGETEWNSIARQQGHLNSNLTKRGKLQAAAMADGLKRYPIKMIYASDLGRAMETAEIIGSALGKTVHPCEGLRERNLGLMQGITKDEFRLQYPEAWERFLENDPDWLLPEGESIRQRHERSISSIEDIAASCTGKTILIVAHGGTLLSMFHKACALPLNRRRNFSLFNGSINIFSISPSNEWFLEIWGDIYHLERHGLQTLDDN